MQSPISSRKASAGNGAKISSPRKPRASPFVYTIIVLFAAVPLVFGVDPVKITIMSMALTAATLPIAIVPFLFLMNDPIYMGKHRNGWVSNSVVAIIILISFVLAVITIPLEIIGA